MWFWSSLSCSGGDTEVCGSGVLCHAQWIHCRYLNNLLNVVVFSGMLRYVVLEFLVMLKGNTEVCGSGVICHVQGKHRGMGFWSLLIFREDATVCSNGYCFFILFINQGLFFVC